MRDALGFLPHGQGELRMLQEGLAPSKEEGTVLLASVGDIMVHRPQYYAQRMGPNTYDFRNNFLHVQRVFRGSDLVLGNLETTILPERDISSYPRFNSPPEILDALAYTGVDVLSTINNHTLDTGSPGVYSTLEQILMRGMTPLGSYAKASDQKFELRVIEGMTIGIAAFSCGVHMGGDVALNGIPSRGMGEQLNVMDGYNAERAFLDVKKVLEPMKEAGSEFLVVLLHWGWEYHREPNAYQRRLAQLLVDEGVDLILGSHPHMVQPIEFVPSSDGLREGLVAFSLGNFLSNQRIEILGVEGTEYGVILFTTLERDAAGSVKVKKATYLPTWVHLYTRERKPIYEIVPIAKPYERAAQFFGADASKLARVFEFTEEVMRDSRVTPYEGLFRPLFESWDILLVQDGSFSVQVR